MININWKTDYHREFTCPNCGQKSLVLQGTTNYKRRFQCKNCKKYVNNSCNVKIDINTVQSKINWRTDYKVGEFACPNPNCHDRNVRLSGKDSHSGKKFFQCKTCLATAVESNGLTSANLSKYTNTKPNIKPFNFNDAQWDLRAINLLYNERTKVTIINFDLIKVDWLKLFVKKYIYQQCQRESSHDTINRKFYVLFKFSEYLFRRCVLTIEQISRDIIRDFVYNCTRSNGEIRRNLGALKDFFTTGNLHNWFKISQDIVRNEDYPKKKIKNPDPISDTVRLQIESNLKKLPEPIARMWVVAFFTAVRPEELAFLKKDCLIQDGGHWKIIWHRNKTKDKHEVPVTRIIAKVIQEQVEYIEELWGNDWPYLFCHYQGISKNDINHPKIQPVKKVISSNNNPLKRAICCLIITENIRDDNGELATFSPSLVRPTRLTQLFEQGHDLAVVSTWAGHKQLATTSLHYTKVSCELIEKEAGHIQKVLVNTDGKPLHYESMPKTFWENPRAHELSLPADHINTPIYGYCGLPLNEDCNKFRACYTCPCFVPIPEKLTLYITNRDQLRAKESRARLNGHDVLVEQYGRQADQLDKIIAILTGGDYEQGINKSSQDKNLN